MTRVYISPVAYAAICPTLPEDAPLWPVKREGGICVEAAVLDGLRAMRKPGESYSDVFLRLAAVGPASR